ncbi:MAG TPA: hypothetical protein VLD55_03730 [Candidatus Sulfobium mesophilum]|nr:hypothetical protein [Candidatus Sulfobium mesophilum]
MPDTPGERNSCLDISLQSAASHIRASDGREIPFTRAVLTIRNICDAEVLDVVPQATLGQEGGTVQDVTSSVSQWAHLSISPGGAADWDVYDLLIPAHPGAASKIHMFGYRAALNWRFELTAWASYRPPGSSIAVQTPVSRWALRWSVENPATGEVGLTIEDLKG